MTDAACKHAHQPIHQRQAVRHGGTGIGGGLIHCFFVDLDGVAKALLTDQQAALLGRKLVQMLLLKRLRRLITH